MLGAIAQVAIGGAAGSVCRYLVALLAARSLGPHHALGTLAVNVAGGFLMGLAFVLLVAARPDGPARLAPLVMAGFLGGFTTFSAFSLDTWALWEAGRPGAAALYVALSVAGSVAGLVGGVAVARGVVA